MLSVGLQENEVARDSVGGLLNDVLNLGASADKKKEELYTDLGKVFQVGSGYRFIVMGT